LLAASDTKKIINILLFWTSENSRKLSKAESFESHEGFAGPYREYTFPPVLTVHLLKSGFKSTFSTSTKHMLNQGSQTQNDSWAAKDSNQDLASMPHRKKILNGKKSLYLEK